MDSLRVVVAAFVVLSVLGPAAAVVGAQSDGGDAECSFPVEETDATGTTVTVPEEPERVVTLNPSAAQTMYEIGAWDKVVGVTKHASNIEGASDKRNVSGAGQTVSIEEVVDAEPDLVLVPNATRSVLEEQGLQTLRENTGAVYHFEEAGSIADIEAKTRLTGRLVGECQGAEATVERMQSQLATVDEAIEGEERPGVLYVFFGYTAGEGTFIDTMIERAGGNNLAPEPGYKPISEEVVVEQNPDWIVLNSDSSTVPDSEAYNATTAVQEDQIVVVNTDYLNRPGPRVVRVVTKLAANFHPEAYAAANVTETPSTPTATPTDGSADRTPSPTATPESTDGGIGPGLTIVTALVALVAAALVGLRTQR